jgi:hypothetical protein
VDRARLGPGGAQGLQARSRQREMAAVRGARGEEAQCGEHF